MIEAIFLIAGAIVATFIVVSLYMAISRDMDFAMLTLLFTLIFVALLIHPIHCYMETYDLPYQCSALQSSIDDIESTLLLMTNNSMDIALGLEAIQLKQELAKTIVEYNECKMKIHSFIDNPFMLFHDLMSEKCVEFGIPLNTL